VKRPIRDFGVDPEGDPFAVLSCGHRQHVRHRPPFSNRPWVVTEEGRREKLGALLDCLRCDRLEFPEGLECYRSTPTFDEGSVPGGLRCNHATRAGVWGRIVVESGALRYVVEGMGGAFELDPEHPGTVVPEVRHRVEPLGAVRFRVEFWRTRPGGTGQAR
jgi:tellurite resistance-related uncharacterized protein